MDGGNGAIARGAGIAQNVGQICSSTINFSQLSNCMRMGKLIMRELTHLILTRTSKVFRLLYNGTLSVP